MNRRDVEILLKYLTKVPVPPNEHDDFIRAVERLEALLHKAKQTA